MVGREGFEPPKSETPGLQPGPFDHFGTDPLLDSVVTIMSEVKSEGESPALSFCWLQISIFCCLPFPIISPTLLCLLLFREARLVCGSAHF